MNREALGLVRAIAYITIEGPPDDCRIATVSRVPETVADQHDVAAARGERGRLEASAHGRLDPQALDESPA